MIGRASQLSSIASSFPVAYCCYYVWAKRRISFILHIEENFIHRFYLPVPLNLTPLNCITRAASQPHAPGEEGSIRGQAGWGGCGMTLEGGRVVQILCQCSATCQEGTNCFNNSLYSVVGNAWMTFFVLREQPFDWSSTHTINVSVQTRLQQPRKKPHCPYTP